jgi:hypothetical protein
MKILTHENISLKIKERMVRQYKLYTKKTLMAKFLKHLDERCKSVMKRRIDYNEAH